MSTLSTIRTQAETIVAASLGNTFRKLPFQFDIAMNDDRSMEAGYAVTYGAVQQLNEIHQKPGVELTVNVAITTRAFIANDDTKGITALDSLYDSAEAIIKKFITDRLDLPTTVYFARLSSMPEPDRIAQGRDILALNMTFQVKGLLL